jgi:hypothetical protein
MGATITTGSRKKYNYAQDKRWKQWSDEIAPIVKQMKEQEERIKTAVKNGADLVERSTGDLLAECVEAPATNFIAVSFKKKGLKV